MTVISGLWRECVCRSLRLGGDGYKYLSAVVWGVQAGKAQASCLTAVPAGWEFFYTFYTQYSQCMLTFNAC